MKFTSTILISILIFAPSSPSAQEHGLTWRGAPLSKTKSFLITECGVSTRLYQNISDVNNDRSFHLEWELGFMRNKSPHWAFGATAYLGADDLSSCVAIKPRLRRWLSPTLAFDMSAGPIIFTMGDRGDDAPGFTAGIALMKGDLLGITASYELTPYRGVTMSPSDDPYYFRGTRHEIYTGIRLGSYPGAAAAVAVPVGVIIWIVSVIDD